MDYQYIKVSFIDSMWVNEKVPSTKLLENGLKYVKNLNLGNKINFHSRLIDHVFNIICNLHRPSSCD